LRQVLRATPRPVVTVPGEVIDAVR